MNGSTKGLAWKPSIRIRHLSDAAPESEGMHSLIAPALLENGSIRIDKREVSVGETSVDGKIDLYGSLPSVFAASSSFLDPAGQARLPSPTLMIKILAVTFLLAGPAAGEDSVIPHRQDRPPNRPYSPEEALRRMVVPEGFRVELVAGEPDIVNPVAMTFDDRGRIYVAESVEYPRKSAGPGRDRIKILEDTDADGRADRFSVFAEGLNIPTGVAVGHGGVWVLNAPDLLFMREKDGREVVVTGFGRTDTHELPNSLTWGPDGWLYGLNGVFNQSRVASEGREYRFTCALFRVHPRTRRFEVVCEGTSNPWGLAWDSDGSAIVSACHWARDHLFHFVETGYYQRQAGAYPPFTLKIGSISTHGHQKTAFCGLAYFDSDAYPEPYRERFYFGNIHGGCINADRIERDGSTYLSHAEPDFLSADDAWFMPVAQKVGPDGCLYILDWYDRYHCYQDANRDPEGIDRGKGRLYRVRYRDSPRATKLDLAAEGDGPLVARLSSPNIFFRESAQRILTERDSPGVRERLRKLVLDEAAPRKPRLHALWSLVGTGSLEPELHLRILADADPAFRAWGVRAAGDIRRVAPAVRDRAAAMARDLSPDVQLQAGIAARKLEGVDALAILVEVLAYSGQDKLIPSIVWPNLHPLLEEQSGRFARLIETADLARAPGLAGILPHAVDRILGSSRPDLGSVRSLAGLLIDRDRDRAAEALAAISRRVEEAPAALREPLRLELEPLLGAMLAGKAGGALQRAATLLAARLGLGAGDVASVRAILLAANEPPEPRIEALEALIALRDPGLPDAVGRILRSSPAAFLARAFAVLGKADDPRLAERVLGAYPGLDPAVRPLALDLLLTREPWARRLLDAVREGKLPRSTLTAHHLRRILESNDREAVWAVEKTWGTVRSERSPERERVVAEMAELLRKRPGDWRSGEGVFRRHCAQCHAIHGEGKNVGPDLTSSGRTTFEQLLASVFDPSLVIGPGYETTTVVSRDGRNLTGIVTENGEGRIVLKLPGGEEAAVARANVKYKLSSRLSLMPEGIESSLAAQEIADLFAFLSLDRHPREPDARLITGAPAPGGPAETDPPVGRQAPPRGYTAPPRGYTIPLIDLSAETRRQVIVDREPGQYLGHPTTVLLEDGKTILIVYPKGHGRGAIVFKRSRDAGLTWSERLAVPENWATSLETPTIHRVVDPSGKKRLIIFSGLYPCRMAVSENDGVTWTPLKPAGDWGGIVAMSSIVEERGAAGGYIALFHDDGRFIREGSRQEKPVIFTLLKTLSRDGGLTWSLPEPIFKSSEIHLCEPGVLRSPDGRELAALLRENSRRRNSHVIFSHDEGKTWTEPRELPGALTGDRHTGRYAPDGRLFVSFRDTTLESPTKGDWVAWVGRYEDIAQGREGQYRVRLMKNHKGQDCAYPGVEVLPDGTIVTTTYGHWTADEQPYIVSVRLKVEELDGKARGR